jgi:DNA-binding FadR family transcriptional regulator
VTDHFALPKYYTNATSEIDTIQEGVKGHQRVRLGTLKVPRASELVAEKLRSLILSGTITEGQNLPPEKELVLQLGVSRATLREALRMLESEGLITTKTGPKGGATVQRPGGANLTRSLALLLQLEETPFQMVLEVRRLLQPICAELAVQRITPQEMEELESWVEVMRQNLENIPAYLEGQLHFHTGIISAAHNDVLRLYTTSVGELISAQTARVGLSLPARKTGLKAAESILEAIKEGNGTLAARRVEAHLRAFEAVLTKG